MRVNNRDGSGLGSLCRNLKDRCYDLYAESYIGVIATDREFLDGYSRVGGGDGPFRLGRTSSVGFQYAASQHRDETGAERSGPIFCLVSSL